MGESCDCMGRGGVGGNSTARHRALRITGRPNRESACGRGTQVKTYVDLDEREAGTGAPKILEERTSSAWVLKDPPPLRGKGEVGGGQDDSRLKKKKKRYEKEETPRRIQPAKRSLQ